MRYSTVLIVTTLAAAMLLLPGCARRADAPDGHERHSTEPAEQNSQEEGALLDPGSIAAEFPGKIVYATERDVDVEALRRDCRRRGGYFNECGSPCAEGEICAAVCAFTCEFR